VSETLCIPREAAGILLQASPGSNECGRCPDFDGCSSEYSCEGNKREICHYLPQFNIYQTICDAPDTLAGHFLTPPVSDCHLKYYRPDSILQFYPHLCHAKNLLFLSELRHLWPLSPNSASDSNVRETSARNLCQ